MPIDLTVMNSDLGHVIADMPLTFTYNGNDYTCSEDSNPEVYDQEEAGYVETRDKRLTIQISQFTANSETVPGPTARITIATQGWNIMSVTPSPDRNSETWDVSLNSSE